MVQDTGFARNDLRACHFHQLTLRRRKHNFALIARRDLHMPFFQAAFCSRVEWNQPNPSG
jgi:hypothetical protein